MKSKVVVGLGLCVVALTAFGVGVAFLPQLWADAPYSWFLVEQDKKVTVKVHLPQSDAKVTVDGKEIPGKGEKREFNVTTGKKELTVAATWEPNNYTKIVRTRKAEVKDVVDVDLSSPNPKMPDDITVIYVPTPQDVVEEMCKLGKVTKDDVVYDLGCGDGRMVITAIQKFAAKKGVGVDINPERIAECKKNAAEAKVADKVQFRVGDVLKVDDLPEATVVLLYMGDDINLRLRPLLKSKLKPGSRVVSHRFLMGDWTPTTTITYRGQDGGSYDLHLWVIDEKKKQ